MIDRAEKMVKILFELEQDESGYPPFGVESLWTEPEGEHYRIRNTPFFVSGVNLDDCVDAEERDGELYFRSVVSRSGNKTMRVFCPDEDSCLRLREDLEELGAGTELSHLPSLFSVNIPKALEYGMVRDHLDEQKDLHEFEYEDGEG